MGGGISRQPRRDRRSDPCQAPIRCSTRISSAQTPRLSWNTRSASPTSGPSRPSMSL